MKVIIDRFEAEFAVCETEDRQMLNIHRNRLPKEAKEGDVLRIAEGGVAIDKEETAVRRRRSKEMIDNLWE
ncbi:MAG: DUF3006 domain-containing protein [bacterium]|jgi:hypothetical protein